MRVLILGAGGHAQVVADALWAAHREGAPAYPIGYVDDDKGLIGQRRLGLPVLGDSGAVAQIEHDAVVLGIGSNRIRRRLYDALSEAGECILAVRHPRAVVAQDVELPAGCVLCAGAIVNPGTRLGVNVILNTGCTVDHHNRIGDHAHIAPGAHLGGDVHVGEGTLVGIGAVVMPQRRVGNWSIVGAGATVHRDVPDGVTVVGTPAAPLTGEK